MDAFINEFWATRYLHFTLFHISCVSTCVSVNKLSLKCDDKNIFRVHITFHWKPGSILTWRQLWRHRWPCRLSLWQPAVPAVTTNLALWQLLISMVWENTKLYSIQVSWDFLYLILGPIWIRIIDINPNRNKATLISPIIQINENKCYINAPYACWVKVYQYNTWIQNQFPPFH